MVFCKDGPHIFLYSLKYFGDEYGVRGSTFGQFFGSSRSHVKSIAICPRIRVSHFGIIKTPKKLRNTLYNKEQNKNLLNCLPYFGPYETPFLGSLRRPWNVTGTFRTRRVSQGSPDIRHWFLFDRDQLLGRL